MVFFKKWRRKRTAGGPFPPEWLDIIEKNVSIYRKLNFIDKAELRRHILVFLAEKDFVGCGGLKITDEMRVTIAAQACVLLLHRQTDYYPGLRSILVYPTAYVARASEHLPSGVVEEGYDIRLGESWHHGSVVLSWDDVLWGGKKARDGQNVVFHEFAHQLDSSWGRGDSSAVLQSRPAFIEWAKVLHENYLKLQQALGANRPTVLGSYAGESPAEFFAVATECFFERPGDLRKSYPDLYEEMKNFYHQDPISWG